MSKLSQFIASLWRKTKEAAARLCLRVVVVEKVVFVRKPAPLRVPRCRVSPETAAKFGQLALPFNPE